MAEHIELRQLFSDGDLKNKVEVACVIAAGKIRIEDAGVDNHANRLVWARRVFDGPHDIRDPMLMVLLADNSEVSIEVIRAVSREALQSLVDGAVDFFADGS